MKKKAAKKPSAKRSAAGTKDAELKAAAETAAISPAKKRAANTISKTAVAGTGTKTVAKKEPKRSAKKAILDVTAELASGEPRVEISPAFKTLAEPALPELKRENRAHLMMQTPTRAYFYWSVKEDPYQLLHKAFGQDTASYTLVLKLTDLHRGIEEIHPAEPEGNWWFDVEPAGRYEAEIGFYAPNRPYFRVIYSNTIETPRRSPSPHPATDSDWNVSANKFAEVLDVAGFSHDAFDVVMAGDDHAAAERRTRIAFSSFINVDDDDLRAIAAEDIRYSLRALASGFRIEELRSRIGPTLFAFLQANADKIAAGNAMNALTEYFDADAAEFSEHEFGSGVYGASLVNFPRTQKTRYMPVSS